MYVNVRVYILVEVGFNVFLSLFKYFSQRNKQTVGDKSLSRESLFLVRSGTGAMLANCREYLLFASFGG